MQVGKNSTFSDINMPGIFEDVPRYKVYSPDLIVRTPIQPIEVCGFVINIFFMLVLTKNQRQLCLNRNSTSQAIFNKME